MGNKYNPNSCFADPNCTRGTRDGLKCNYVSAATFTRTDTAVLNCSEEGGEDAEVMAEVIAEAELRSGQQNHCDESFCYLWAKSIA